jgi:hypothetical protein
MIRKYSKDNFSREKYGQNKKKKKKKVFGNP